MDELLAVYMILGFMCALLIGMPVGIGIALSGFLFGWMGFGDFLFNLVPSRIYGVVTKYEFLAIPLFVYMGVMLEKSRVAEDMLEVVGRLSGRLNGGMAIALIVVGVLMGASTGIVGATVVTLTMLTMPVLLKRNYDGGIAAGAICASGTLGQIIPPSLVLILLADIMGESVGTLFAAAMMPGLMLAGLYIGFILILGKLRPEMMPPIPSEERAEIAGWALARKAAMALAPPLLLVGGVLGTIIGGLAAPTEAAGVGAALSIMIAALYGRLNLRMIWEAAEGALRISAMIFFILIAAQVFSVAFRGLDGEDLVQDALALLPGGETGALLFLMALLFVLGFFLEWIEISYIALPLLLPFFVAAGTDMVWLAALIALNLQTSFLTPPFGWALFFLKGAAPPQVSTGMIYRGVVPFICIQGIALVLLFNFPGIATWLPDALAHLTGHLFDLVIEDQDSAHDRLTRGEVLGALTSRAAPLPGCDVAPMGRLRYVATASPAFLARHFAAGVTADTLATAPMLQFDSRDQLQHRWIVHATGATLSPPCHRLPSSEGFATAARLGLGWGMNPEPLVAEDLARGTLRPLLPGTPLDTALYWQSSRLMGPALDPVTRALRRAARRGLLPPE